MRINDGNGNDDVRVGCRDQGLSLGLIVGQRHGFEVPDCRVVLWSSGSLMFAFECDAAPVAVDADLEDRGVVDQAIYGGQGHGRVWEDLSPGAKGLVCRD